MPLTANFNGVKIAARDAEKGQQYVCRWCGHLMILKRGMIKVSHFAHVPDADCPYHKPESPEHLTMKAEIASLVSGSEIEVDYYDEKGILTVFDVVDSQSKTAFECQCSSISQEEYEQREQCAKENGLHIQWLFGTSLGAFGKETTCGQAIMAKTGWLELLIADVDKWDFVRRNLELTLRKAGAFTTEINQSISRSKNIRTLRYHRFRDKDGKSQWFRVRLESPKYSKGGGYCKTIWLYRAWLQSCLGPDDF